MLTPFRLKIKGRVMAQIVKNLLQRRRSGFNFWVRKIPWRKEWLPNPIFLPGEFHGQSNLVSYSPWDTRVSDITVHGILQASKYIYKMINNSEHKQ